MRHSDDTPPHFFITEKKQNMIIFCDGDYYTQMFSYYCIPVYTC